MRTRTLALILFLLIGGVASAQRYAIRVVFNTNLRASYSLEAAVLESAPAAGALNSNDADV